MHSNAFCTCKAFYEQKQEEIMIIQSFFRHTLETASKSFTKLTRSFSFIFCYLCRQATMISIPPEPRYNAPNPNIPPQPQSNAPNPFIPPQPQGEAPSPDRRGVYSVTWNASSPSPYRGPPPPAVVEVSSKSKTLKPPLVYGPPSESQGSNSDEDQPYYVGTLKASTAAAR